MTPHWEELLATFSERDAVKIQKLQNHQFSLKSDSITAGDGR